MQTINSINQSIVRGLINDVWHVIITMKSRARSSCDWWSHSHVTMTSHSRALIYLSLLEVMLGQRVIVTISQVVVAPSSLWSIGCACSARLAVPTHIKFVIGVVLYQSNLFYFTPSSFEYWPSESRFDVGSLKDFDVQQSLIELTWRLAWHVKGARSGQGVRGQELV